MLTADFAKIEFSFTEMLSRLFTELTGDEKKASEETEALLRSLQEEKTVGLRVNPLRLQGKNDEEFLRDVSFMEGADPVSWCSEGFLLKNTENDSNRPGKNPLHDAGLYYMQDPSAMLPVFLLHPLPGEKVMDLCASPGGKSTQIGGKLLGKGLLVSNEYVTGRTMPLLQNLERFGIPNCLVLSEDSSVLSRRLSFYFDKVLVDAPCSGEGMFRKEPAAVTDWSAETVAMCAKRQAEILDEAAKMVRTGGILVYSTCTFNLFEDECTVQAFLERNPEFSLLPYGKEEELFKAGVFPGSLPGTYHLFPHKIKGEGHFAAVLSKGEATVSSEYKAGGKEPFFSFSSDESKSHFKKNGKGNKGGDKSAERGNVADKEKLFRDFASESLTPEGICFISSCGALQWINDSLYAVPSDTDLFNGLKVLRRGLFLGEAKKGRFEPSHTLAMCLGTKDTFRSIETDYCTEYLHGEEIPGEQSLGNGWVLVTCKGLPLGWGKQAGERIKNHYPKGLRKQY